MTYPPSLPHTVRARAFVASNGELGVLPQDVGAFLSACRADAVEVLGWELWLADHAWGDGGRPVSAIGMWCGGIPVAGESAPSIISGIGDVDDSQRQLEELDLSAEVDAKWAPHVRVNFTLHV